MSILFSPKDDIECQGSKIHISISNFVEFDPDSDELPEELDDDAFYVLSSYYTGRVVFGGSPQYAFSVFFEDDDSVAFGVTWREIISVMQQSGNLDENIFAEHQDNGEELVAYLSENEFFNSAFEAFKQYVQNKIAEH